MPFSGVKPITEDPVGYDPTDKYRDPVKYYQHKEALVATEQVNPVPPDPKEEKPVSTKHTVEAHETPKPALKRGHTKKNDACAAAAEAPPKRARRSTRK